MEARLIELISSLQQLINSNTLLDEALMTEQSNDDDDNDSDIFQQHYDDELVSAIKENEVVISKQMENAQSLSSELRTRHGVFISLDDKLPNYNGSLFLRRLREEESKYRHLTTTPVDDDGGMHL